MTDLFSWRRALAGIFTLLGGSALARVLSAIVMIVIARQMGPQAYGQYSGSLALIGLTTAFFSLGLDSWLLYAGAREPEKLHTRFTSALSIKTIFGLVWFAAWWTIAPLLDQASFPRILIVLGSLAVWLEEIAGITWSALKARLRIDLTLILMLCSGAFFLIITLWLSGRGVQNPAGYMGGKLVAGLLAAGFSILVVVRTIGLRWRPKATWNALRGTLPFALSLAFTVIYGRADLAIVASKLGSEAAGIYAPALTVTNVLFLMPAAIFGVMVPTLSRADPADGRWIQTTTIRFVLLMALLGALLGIGLAWLSPLLIQLLFGAAYQPSADVLRILSPVIALRCPTTALAATLVAVGWQTSRMGVQGICAALNVSLNLLFIEKTGLMGVAVIYVITEAVLLLGTAWMFIRWTRRRKTSP